MVVGEYTRKIIQQRRRALKGWTRQIAKAKYPGSFQPAPGAPPLPALVKAPPPSEPPLIVYTKYGGITTRLADLAKVRAMGEPLFTTPQPEPEPKYRPPPPRIREPPPMRRDIHVTETTPFKLYEAEPTPVLRLGPPKEIVREEGRPPTLMEAGVLGPIVEPPDVSLAPMHVTVGTEYLKAREKEREERPKDIAELIYEFAEPLIPKRTETEIAFGIMPAGLDFGVDITHLVRFGAGLAYGAITFPATVLSLPKTVYTVATDPLGVAGGMVERFIKMPSFFAGEVVSQLAVGYGVGKLIGFGISKYRAKDVTTATEVGQYTFDPVKGFGKIGVDIVIKRKGKLVDITQAQVGFKAGKLFDPSPYAAKIITGKGAMYYALGKGQALYQISTPSGLTSTVAQATGILYKYPGFKPSLASLGISKTLADPTGLLRTAGLAVSKKGFMAYGQKFYSMLFRQPTDVFKITKIITKPGKPSAVPPVAGVQLKTIASLIGKEVVKVGPAPAYTGVLTGAITAFIGKAEPVTKYAPPIEEEMYISPAAARVAGVTMLDTRQRELTLSRMGIGQAQVSKTLQDIGIRKAVIPRERAGLVIKIGRNIGPALRKRPAVKERIALKVKPAVRERARVAMRAIPGVTVPVFKIPKVAPIFIPEIKKKKVIRRKRKVKPKYKYREIRRPVPSIRQLMGI